MAIYTKYCEEKFNLSKGCTTLRLGSPQQYRQSDPQFLRSVPGLVVDPDESKSLVPGSSGVAGVEVVTPSGGKFGFGAKGGEVSFSGITQNRLPNFLLYCVANELRPSIEKARSLDENYDDWFQISDIDQFSNMIQGEVHKKIANCFGFPRGHDFGVLEVRGPVQYYGEGDESSLKEEVRITFMTDHGYWQFGGSTMLDPLVEKGAREIRITEDNMLSYVQGSPIWDAFFKHSRYKCLSEYRIAWFPCRFRIERIPSEKIPKAVPTIVGQESNFYSIIEAPLNVTDKVQFLSNNDFESLIIDVSCFEQRGTPLPIF